MCYEVTVVHGPHSARYLGYTVRQGNSVSISGVGGDFSVRNVFRLALAPTQPRVKG